MKNVISTTKAPVASGPYSQAIEASGSFIYVSGQLPIVASTNEFISEDVADQTRQCMLNIEAILKEKGLSFKDVIKTTIFFKNIEDFGKINDVYKSFFESDYPARSAFAVDGIVRNALVEIEAIAVK